jgi:hypothetical protein
MRFPLPVGLEHEGTVLRSAEIQAPTGGLLKRMRDTMTGKDRTAIYRVALEFGLQAIEGITGKPTQEILRRLYFPDVEFVYFCMAQLDCAGEWPQLTRTCPRCDREFKQEIDLSKVKVVSLDGSGVSAFDNDSRSIPFTLKQGINTLDAERAEYKQGRIGILTFDDWSIVTSSKALLGTSMLKSIARAIVELGPAGRGEVTDSELDKLPASDVKMLESLYNKNVPGVQFPDTTECPHCNETFTVAPIDVVSDFLLRSAE